MEEQLSVKSTGIKYGLIMGLVSFVYGLAIQYAGLAQNTGISMLGFVVTIVFLVLAMREYRGGNGGFMSFKQGLGLGTLAAFLSSLISGGASVLYFSFVDGSPLEEAKRQIREQFETQGMTDAQIDQAMKMSEMFMSPVGMFLMSLIIGTLMGFIFSLVISAIMKKDSPEEAYE